MNFKPTILLLASGLFWTVLPVYARAAQEKDYLSALEADKIRDAETSNERIRLFLAFAEDRLKKFQYELEHPSSNRHGDMLNALLNAYIGCVDDAASHPPQTLTRPERAGWSLRAKRETLSGHLVSRGDVQYGSCRAAYFMGKWMP